MIITNSKHNNDNNENDNNDNNNSSKTVMILYRISWALTRLAVFGACGERPRRRGSLV